MELRKAAKELLHGHVNLDPRLRGDSVYIPTLPSELRAMTRTTRGVRGKAAAATAAKGEKMVKAIGANITAFITKARKTKVNLRNVEYPV